MADERVVRFRFCKGGIVHYRDNIYAYVDWGCGLLFLGLAAILLGVFMVLLGVYGWLGFGVDLWLGLGVAAAGLLVLLVWYFVFYWRVRRVGRLLGKIVQFNGDENTLWYKGGLRRKRLIVEIVNGRVYEASMCTPLSQGYDRICADRYLLLGRRSEGSVYILAPAVYVEDPCCPDTMILVFPRPVREELDAHHYRVCEKEECVEVVEGIGNSRLLLSMKGVLEARRVRLRLRVKPRERDSPRVTLDITPPATTGGEEYKKVLETVGDPLVVVTAKTGQGFARRVFRLLTEPLDEPRYSLSDPKKAVQKSCLRAAGGGMVNPIGEDQAICGDVRLGDYMSEVVLDGDLYTCNVELCPSDSVCAGVEKVAGGSELAGPGASGGGDEGS